MLNVIFRVDSSDLIGTGHIFRCLNLADYINNANIEFICKNYKKNCYDIIEKKYIVHKISTNKNYKVSLNKDTWLGDTQLLDAKKTIEIIKDKNIDLLITDHYAINIEWENYIRPYVKKILVIDDYNNKKHNCDILINQQIENNIKNYIKLLPKNCKLIYGSNNLIMNKKYFNINIKRNIKEIKRINIFMGGSDQSNETFKIIKICNDINIKLNNSIIFDVVVGSCNKNKKLIKNFCNRKKNFNFYFNIDYLEKLFIKADLAIGACGQTIYERIFLQLPTLLITISDNQKMVLEKFTKKNVVIYTGHINNYKNKLYNKLIDLYKNPYILNNISKNCENFLNINNLFKIKYIINKHINT